MTIDFKEIEKANSSRGLQDSFELFTRDFLEAMVYQIVENPGRGPDGGIDIKIKETIKGISNYESSIYWLVSCKHYAHSGKSINSDIEQDIADRVATNQCDGFIGVYSTIPAKSLINKLNGLSNSLQYSIFDPARIEREIIGYSSMEVIFKRYFPESYVKWKNLENYKEPIKLFDFYCKKRFQIDSVSNKIDYLSSLFGNVENIYKAI